MRTLFSTTGSPFARAVRVVLDDLGLDYHRREEVTTPSVEERAKVSPTLQVPALTDGTMTLWESGLISEYLLATYPDRPDRTPPLAAGVYRSDSQWRDRLVLATVQTLGTAATTIGQMKWSGANLETYAFLTRHADRVPHLMSWLEDQLTGSEEGFLPGVLSVQDICLACHLGYIEKRPLGLPLDLQSYPKIDALCRRLARRESFRRNPILWWEPGVIGYEADGVTPVYGRPT